MVPTNKPLTFAGYLAAFTAAVHTVAGTYEVHTPLLGSALPESLALLLYACWHLVTAALCLSAWALLRPLKPGTSASHAALTGAIGILWTSFGLIFIAVALLFGESLNTLLVLPQWALLLPVGALAWVGSRKLVLRNEQGSTC
jgi:hypothetical protein